MDRSMPYSFSSLKKSKIFDQKEAISIFLRFFEMSKKYKTHKIVDFHKLREFLTDDTYLVMNNHPRYRGNHLFFTGNVVITTKEDLLYFISGPIDKFNLINPLFIVPVNSYNPPNYMITSQEDPVFEILVATGG